MAQQPRTQQQARPQQQPKQEVAVVSPLKSTVEAFHQLSPKLLKALPENIKRERMERIFEHALTKNRELLECTRDSLWTAISEAATDGLLPDGREGAMVVRKDWKTGKKVAKWQPMAEGIRKKARNSGEVATWEVSVVYEKDTFKFVKGDDPRIVHEPFMGAEHGPWVAVYSIVTLKDGSKLRDVMWRPEVEAIRDKYSDGWRAFKAEKIKSTPWADSPEEMARKTLVHRHRKEVPMSAELNDMILRDMEADRREDDDAPQLNAKPEPKKLTNGSKKPDPMDDFAGRGDTHTIPGEDAKPGDEVYEDVSDEPHDPETGELTGQGEPEAADAYEAGRATAEEGRGVWPIPDKFRTAKELGDAFVAGWQERKNELEDERK